MESGKAFAWTIRVVGTALFALGGGCLVLVSLLGVPSYWYFLCFCALPVVAAFWAWRPRVGAALSIGPVIAVIAWLRFLSGPTLASAVACVVVALFCVFVAAKGAGSMYAPVALSLCFLSAAFLVDRRFTDRVTIQSYRVQVALDGNAPWGKVGPEWSGGSPPIVLYRPVGNSFCYVAFKSRELHDLLRYKDGESVQMQVNEFKDFGEERGYNVRAVDGLLLANGSHVVRDAERFSGQILGSSGNSSQNCW